MEGKKLNLKWVTEVIGEDYKNWKKGDVVRVQAQTGTGKTLMITGNDKVKGMIDRMEDYEELIYICNRIELKRQIKLDLLKKYNLEIPTIIEELDNKKKIKNITITSYHAIAYRELEKIYNDKDYSLDKYSYIVCDECHFFTADGDFNNKTRLAYKSLVKTRHRNAIKIFISATMDEVANAIDKVMKEYKLDIFKKNTIHTYSTGIDYSYLNTKYFTKISDIITLIKNDKSNDKWLVFVTSKSNGKDILDKLTSYNISSELIISGTNNKESKNITTESKFNCKVLITTKVLDNGVNIKDVDVKNLVVMANDKTTFLQEIGRIRFRIDNAPNINLYIYVSNKRVFNTFINKVYEPKFNSYNLFVDNKKEFEKKYDNDLSKVYDDIFYREVNTNKYKVNKFGLVRLFRDMSFAKDMLEKLENDKFAFIKEQLSWLGLEDTFSKENLIENVAEDSNLELLKNFLDNAYKNDERFTKEYFLSKMDEFINADESLRIELNKIDGGKSRKKGMKAYNDLFSNKLKINYNVGSKEVKKTIDGKRKKFTYWTIFLINE